MLRSKVDEGMAASEICDRVLGEISEDLISKAIGDAEQAKLIELYTEQFIVNQVERLLISLAQMEMNASRTKS